MQSVLQLKTLIKFLLDLLTSIIRNDEDLRVTAQHTNNNIAIL